MVSDLANLPAPRPPAVRGQLWSESMASMVAVDTAHEVLVRVFPL